MAGCRDLTREARRLLLAVTGQAAPCPEEPWLAQMAAVPLPPVDPVRLGTALRERHRIDGHPNSSARRGSGECWLQLDRHCCGDRTVAVRCWRGFR